MIMNGVLLVSVLVALQAGNGAAAFGSQAGFVQHRSRSASNSFSSAAADGQRSSVLFYSFPESSFQNDPELIMSAGGGLPVVPAGDRSLFDPDVEGLLADHSLNDRLAKGSQYVYENANDGLPFMADPTSTGVDAPHWLDAQNWLEGLDADGAVPLNFAKPTQPAIATVLGKTRLITADAPGDIEHIVLELPEGMHYVEGQSISIIPPGLQEAKNGKQRAHKPRLYSIASTRYGDILNGRTVSLCVRRAEYTDPETGLVDPAKKGVCSNFLCDATPGTKVEVAGPIGKTMLLPPIDDPETFQPQASTDIILVATGTGIAPFRGFLHRLFVEETVARHMYQGKVWMVLGVPTTGSLLYHSELMAMQENPKNGHQLELDFAISREQTNQQDGGKRYVQHVLTEQADKLLERLDNGAHIYFCGLKGMMPGITDALEQLCIRKNLNWDDKFKQYKQNGQWHVEVY
eukprot:CAMPEP_0119569832 /NCGR_PEP_ID=MMETSP1352-20130426/42737_1 /TAXON_ID=265584 /ORGANISM="Stauroneis constricta, Strain CCMP1120" /LENGTH=460 /DNA_ID=CAMNT_0007619453 /DNA_START=25 /DNA_END=1407 /DNA_ORIENTATION=+